MISSILPGLIALLCVVTITLQNRAFRKSTLQLLEQKMDELISVSHLNAEDRAELGLPTAKPKPPQGSAGVGHVKLAPGMKFDPPSALLRPEPLPKPEVKHVPNCEGKHEWSGLVLEEPRRDFNNVYTDDDDMAYVRTCVVCGFRQIRGEMDYSGNRGRREWHDD